MKNKTLNTRNNESLSKGLFPQVDGTFLALTFSESKEFKTYRGAKNWLAKRGVIVEEEKKEETFKPSIQQLEIEANIVMKKGLAVHKIAKVTERDGDFEPTEFSTECGIKGKDEWRTTDSEVTCSKCQKKMNMDKDLKDGEWFRKGTHDIAHQVESSNMPYGDISDEGQVVYFVKTTCGRTFEAPSFNRVDYKREEACKVCAELANKPDEEEESEEEATTPVEYHLAGEGPQEFELHIENREAHYIFKSREAFHHWIATKDKYQEVGTIRDWSMAINGEVHQGEGGNSLEKVLKTFDLFATRDLCDSEEDLEEIKRRLEGRYPKYLLGWFKKIGERKGAITLSKPDLIRLADSLKIDLPHSYTKEILASKIQARIQFLRGKGMNL